MINKNKTLNEEINRMKSLMSEELLYGNLVDKGINEDILKEEWVVINNLINEELLIEQPWRQIFKNLKMSFKSAPFKALYSVDGFNKVLKKGRTPKNINELNTFFQTSPVIVLQSLKKQTGDRGNIWRSIANVNSKDWMLFLEGMNDMTLNPIKYLSKDGKSLVIPDEFHRLFYNMPESLIISISDNVIKNGGKVKMKEFYKKIKNLPGKTYEKMRNKIKSFFGKGKLKKVSVTDVVADGATTSSKSIKVSNIEEVSKVLEDLINGTIKKLTPKLRALINADPDALSKLKYILTEEQVKIVLNGSGVLIDPQTGHLILSPTKQTADLVQLLLPKMEQATEELGKTNPTKLKRLWSWITKQWGTLGPRNDPEFYKWKPSPHGAVRWVFPTIHFLSRKILWLASKIPGVTTAIPAKSMPALTPLGKWDPHGGRVKDVYAAAQSILPTGVVRIGLEASIIGYFWISYEEGDMEFIDDDMSIAPLFSKSSEFILYRLLPVLRKGLGFLPGIGGLGEKLLTDYCENEVTGEKEQQRCINTMKDYYNTFETTKEKAEKFVADVEKAEKDMAEGMDVCSDEYTNKPDWLEMKTTIKKTEELSKKLKKYDPIIKEFLGIDKKEKKVVMNYFLGDEITSKEFTKAYKEWFNYCNQEEEEYFQDTENKQDTTKQPENKQDTTIDYERITQHQLPPVTIEGNWDPSIKLHFSADVVIIAHEEETA